MWRELPHFAHPVAIIAAGCFLLYSNFSQAGQIRRLELSEDHPGTVVLALGRSTAISFGSRPEKVVPGSPQAVQINFLGSDLTVTPVSRKPGNLLVYTKSGRFVILFRIGSDAEYDDVVKVGAYTVGRPVHLLTDSFRAVSFRVQTKAKGAGNPPQVPTSVTLLVTSSDQEASGSDLMDIFGAGGPYRCQGCVLKLNGDSPRLSCVKPISEIRCESRSAVLIVKRVSS